MYGRRRPRDERHLFAVARQPPWVEYEKVGKRIDELRALVVTSAKYGAFRIEGDRESRTAAIRRLADKTRVGKAVDPTMGIYAAYLYADANVPEALRSLQSYMRE